MDNYFSCANTPQGFISYFGDAYDIDRISQVLHIKGGSGVGKSTLMREIASLAETRGYEVTRIYCSSDPSSLDGIVIGDRLAVLDATMPHISDPVYPALNGRIIDLAHFLDSDILRADKDTIAHYVHAKKKCYREMYTLLSTLEPIAEAVQSVISLSSDLGRIADDIAHSLCSTGHSNRRGFLRAIDVGGVIDRTSEIVGERRVYNVRSSCHLASLHLVDAINRRLDALSIPHQRYYSILMTDMVETISTPSEIVTISTSPSPHEIVDIDSMVNIDNANAYDVLMRHIGEIISLAESSLQNARTAHNALEQCYKKAMDYTALESYKARLYSDIQLNLL